MTSVECQNGEQCKMDDMVGLKTKTNIPTLSLKDMDKSNSLESLVSATTTNTFYYSSSDSLAESSSPSSADSDVAFPQASKNGNGTVSSGCECREVDLASSTESCCMDDECSPVSKNPHMYSSSEKILSSDEQEQDLNTSSSDDSSLPTNNTKHRLLKYNKELVDTPLDDSDTTDEMIDLEWATEPTISHKNPTRSKTSYLRMALPMILCFCLFQFSSILTTFTTYLFVVPRVDISSRPAPDMLLDNLPPLPSSMKGAEGLIGIMTFFVIVASFFNTHHRFSIIRRIFYLMGIILMLRLLCIVMTTFSVPFDEDVRRCVALQKLSNVQRLQHSFASLAGLGTNYQCGDYVFSGHTSSMTLSVCFLRYYVSSAFPKRRWIYPVMNTVLLTCNLTAMFLIVWAKQHYTVDVILGFVLTNVIFMVYHMKLELIVANRNNKRMKLSSNFAFFDRIFTPFIDFLEKDVERVDNEYDLKPFELIRKYYRWVVTKLKSDLP